MLHAVIMAGGSGTRFWPESRAERPKQLLRMVDDRSMLRATVDRLADLVPLDRVLIATTAQLAVTIAEELPELPRDSILAEPCKRNTAPCIGLAAAKIARQDPGGTMAVVYLGAFISFGAYALYNLGLSRVPASQASAFINLIPVFTVFLGWLILDEKFSPHQYFAALLILTGIFYTQSQSRRIAGPSTVKPKLKK